MPEMRAQSPDMGELLVTRGDQLILARDVPLSYGAQFGPDASDVSEWMRLSAEAVDALK